MNYLNKIINYIARFRRVVVNNKNQKKLKNKDFTLISSNCNGAFILHDLKLKFLTPTINLFFYPEDFLKFVNNIENYLSQELKFIETDNSYPIGMIDDIKIHFMHYANNEQALDQWERRKKRVNYNNIFIMMTDRDGCNEAIFQEFEKLPYENKILFTNQYYEQYPSTFYIKGFEEDNCVGDIYEYKNISGEKFYDQFNYIEWFNSNKVN